ncbi:MAG: hypothetical protein ACXWRU_19455 [Pseudobdellovibrionaceae bacterium]
MKIKIILEIAFILLLSGCAVSTIIYNVSSTPAPAKIEINGRERCSETPCSVELTCKIGMYGMRTSPVFFTAFPLVNNDQLHPQSAFKKVCTKDSEKKSEELKFDLNQPKIGDFESGSHVPFIFKKYFAVNSNHIEPFHPKNRDYHLVGYGFSFGKEIYSSENAKIWSSVNFFEGRDEYSADQSSIVPSAYGVSNFYHFHPKVMEALYFSSGPLYMHQYYGDESDTLGIYAGGGILLFNILSFGSLYPGEKKFTLGDLKMDVSFNWGSVFPINHLDRNYIKSDVFVLLYY